MSRQRRKTVVCQVCHQDKRLSEVVLGAVVRDSLMRALQQQYPAWSPEGFICLADLNRLRAAYIQQARQQEKGELSQLEAEVVQSLQEQDLLARNLNVAFEQQLTRSERIADNVAAFGGSWTFISAFAAVLISWVILNSTALLYQPFDPYPYIFLNLVLSSIAAIQAPFILMSQNRQDAKDRLRSEHDYRVNLKAELEIRSLNSKIDLLLTHQWQRLLEIQQMQVELLEELEDLLQRTSRGRSY